MGYSSWPLPRAEYFHVELTEGNVFYLFGFLFIYYGNELFFTNLVMCLWGNDYHGGTEKLLSKPVSGRSEVEITHIPKMHTQFSSAHF